MRSLPPGLVVLALLLLGGPAARAQATREPDVEVDVDARLDVADSALVSSATFAVRNDGAAPITTVTLVLYGARFREVDPAITDITYDRYYAPWFDAGDLVVSAATDPGGRALAVRPREEAEAALSPTWPRLPAGTVVEVELLEPVPPGGWARVQVASRLVIPSRLGAFGRRGARVVLEGGWLPMVPAYDARTERRDPHGPMALARHRVRLAVSPDDDDEPPRVVVGGRMLDEQPDPQAAVEVIAPAVSLVLGDDLEALARVGPIGEAPGAIVLGEEGDDARAQRIVRIAEVAGQYLRRLGPDLPADTVTFVRAPLRDRFVHVTGDGVVLYSDRLFHVLLPLQSFHEAEVGRATIEALLRQAFSGRDPGPDREWLLEALSWLVGRDWLEARAALSGRSLRRGVSVFDFIPAVDAIVRAPRFVGSDVYYGRFHEAQDAVPDELSRALSRRPRGRIVAEKLRDALGEERLRTWVQRCLDPAAPEVGRVTAEEVAGRELGAFFSLWTEPPQPNQNLVLEDVEVLEALPDGTERVRVKIRREGDARPGQVGEPVVVETRDPKDQPIRATWDGLGDEGVIVTTRADRILWSPIVLDPEERVQQWARGDDEDPRLAKVLLNRASFRLDLNRANRNEAAVGFTIIPGYDYSHAVLVDGFYEQDERGITVGYARGFGWTLDERTYGIGIGARTNVASLNEGVLDRRSGVQETRGTLVSGEVNLSFDTRLFRFNPTWGVGVGAGLEHGDKLFGTDFRFDLVSVNLELVYSIVRGTQLGVEVIAGQIEGTDVPSQRLFDAGGEGTVRGVEASLFVDRALVCIRGEVRQMLVEDLDVPLLWLAWMRKAQLVLFLDAGCVGESIDRIWKDEENWKWGTGIGTRVFIDVFGVQPVVVRFDLGFRIDETEELGPQYYVGVGQSF